MLKLIIKKLLEIGRIRIRKFLNIPPNYVGDNGCIRAAASFVARNQIGGDYLEFGVWRGYSFVVVYHAINQQRNIVIKNDYQDTEFVKWKSNTPRFFAFDSFQGLPGGDNINRMADYQEGSYSCSENDFLKNIEDQEVDTRTVQTVKGFYDSTCNEDTKKKYNITKAAIVMIDCDLYESTVFVLNFLSDIVQQGTILIFDDWFRFQGNPNAGEQRACREWLDKNPHIELIEF